MQSRLEVVFNYVILSIFSLAVLIPIVWLIGTALSPNTSGKLDFSDLRWDNFVQAWVRVDFGRHLLISLTLAVVVVVVSSVITSMAAYALVVLRLPGGRWLFPVFLTGIMIPIEGIIVPLYFTLRSYQLAGSLIGLLIAHIGLSVSFGVFWMRAAFAAVPGGIIESAQLDGAGCVGTLWYVALPIVRPALVTLALLTFMWTWNDFFLAFVLINDPGQLPITVALGAFSTQRTNDINLMSAAAVLVSLPVVVLYVFFQRHFIQGVLSGALKG